MKPMSYDYKDKISDDYRKEMMQERRMIGNAVLGFEACQRDGDIEIRYKEDDFSQTGLTAKATIHVVNGIGVPNPYSLVEKAKAKIVGGTAPQ